jgi:hypothetical protein
VTEVNPPVSAAWLSVHVGRALACLRPAQPRNTMEDTTTFRGMPVRTLMRRQGEEHQTQHYVPYYLSIVFVLSLNYAIGIISMFFPLVRCSIILSRLFLTYLHPCFLPYVQIYQISVRLLMSHEKCPIWQVLFILKFGTFAFYFCIVLYFLQVHNGLLQVSKMSHPFFSFLSNTSCINRLKKSCRVSHFIFLPYQFPNNSIIWTLNVCLVISVFLLNSMNYRFGKNLEYLWQTSKNHLVHNACVKILHVSKK